MMWLNLYSIIVGDFLLFIYAVVRQQFRHFTFFWLDLITEFRTFPTTLWKPGVFFFEQDLVAILKAVLDWIKHTSKTLHLVSLLLLTVYWLLLFLITILFSWF